MVGSTLVVISIVGLLGIGIGALVAPGIASGQYGIVIADARAAAFLRAMGIRDLSLGLVLWILAARSDTVTLGWAMLALAPVAVVDFVLVMADRRGAGAITTPRGAAAAPLLHAGGAIALLVAGIALLSGV